MGKRKSTRFQGVQARESDTRRFNGRPDVCYTIDYRDASGKRVRKDIGWASEGFTAAYAAKLRAQCILQAKTAALGCPHAPQAPLFGVALERYVHDWLLANGKAAESVLSLRRHLKPIENLPLDQITTYQLDKIMAGMRAKGLALQTIVHVMALVRRVCRRMKLWGLYAGDIPAVSLPKVNNARERALTPEEARALLAALQQRSFSVWLMALISLMCGLRFGEIAALRHGDIRHDEQMIYIRESKSGKARHVFMPPLVSEALQQLEGGYDDLIFPDRNGKKPRNLSKVFARTVEALGLNTDHQQPIRDRRLRIVFHSLRHTYASWLAMNGLSELALASLLGHASTAMTKRYSHLMDSARKDAALTVQQLFTGERA